MKNNFFKLYIRFLLKNKLFTFINVFGLAIGVVTCVMLLKYIDYQTSYDSFYPDYNQVYRINTDVFKNNQIVDKTAKSFSALAPTLEAELVEVEATTRFEHEKCLMDYREKDFKINDRDVLWVDNTFFDVFKFKILKGDKTTPLTRPFTTAISSSTAKLYFKNEDPIGKIVNLNGTDYPMEVTAVFEDVPKNSHIKCDFLTSIATGYSKGWDSPNGNWKRTSKYTYVKLKKGITAEDFQSKLEILLNKYYDSKTPEIRVSLNIIPVKDIHLKAHFKDEITPSSGVSITRINFLFIIAIIIMVVAWVNFINLTISKSMTRTLEIGIKKTLGAVKFSLMGDFLLESIFMSVLAFIVAVFLITTGTLFIDQFTEFDFIRDIWTNVSFWVQILLFMLLGAIIAGLYPAISLSKLLPSKTLKGILPHQNMLLKRGLVTFQFIVAIGLIFGTLTIYDQLTFMKTKELGFNAANKLIIRAPKSMNSHKLAFSNMHSFKNTVSELSGVNSISASRSIPGQQVLYTSPYFKQKSKDKISESNYQMAIIDHDFFDTYNIPLIAGRNFTSNYKNHTSDIILNEKSVELLGFESPEEALNQQVIGPENKEYTVIGVNKNYHQHGLKSDLQPTIYKYVLKYNYIHGHYSIAANKELLESLVPKVKAIWSEIYPEDTFEYFFMDEYFNKQYEQEDSFMQIFLIASMISILICCLGLYGLSAYTALQRKKETAIRKIIGASVKDIFILFFKEYVYLVIFSLLIALPISYYMLESWLSNYVYRVSISLLLVVLSVLILFAVVLIAVLKHTISLIKINPSDNIKV